MEPHGAWNINKRKKCLRNILQSNKIWRHLAENKPNSYCTRNRGEEMTIGWIYLRKGLSSTAKPFTGNKEKGKGEDQDWAEEEYSKCKWQWKDNAGTIY